jgi:hypothetical protein
VPAAFAGAQLAGLLWFLNPALPLSAPAIARAALWYTALLAPVSIAAHLAVARWRGVAPARLLPWSLTVVAAAGAVGDGVHASLYAYLLPEAINAQLIKAGLWLALAAVLLFYTALLHTLHHRPYGLRSRALVALAVLGGVTTTFDRRTSYRAPALEEPEVSVAAAPEAPPRVVVVALPTATLDALLPLARQGKLPFLAQALDAGSAARLAIFSPARPAALWTSWATGKLPFRHGIAGPARFSAPLVGEGARLALVPLAPGFPGWGLAGGKRLPIERRDRRALTAWEIFDAAGRDVETVGFGGWLGGRPGRRRVVDAAEGSVAGRELVALGREELARALAGDRLRLAEVRAIESRARPPSALFVELTGLERSSFALYGGFAAASFEGKRSAAATSAARALETYLGALDGELALLWSALAGRALLVVSSPYGIDAPRGAVRSLLSAELELRGSLVGAPDGVLLLRGDGIRAGVQVSEGRLVDVVPTLLYAAGLPLARDFDGRVLAELFEPAVLQRRALSFVPSFERLRPARRRRAP